MLVSKSIPNLAGGISQQAPSLRLINQCEKQVNFRSSLVNGLCSRAPVKEAYPCTKEEALFVKADRDNKTTYDLLISPNKITVYDVEGNAAIPKLSAEAHAYLQIPKDSTVEESYKTLTLSDYTFVLNRHVKVGMTNKTSGAYVHQALVFVKGVNTSTTWALTLDSKTRSVGYGGANPSSGVPNLYIDGVKVKSDIPISTSDVANYLYLGSDNKPIFAGFTIKRCGAVLWIRKTDGSNFTVGFTDTRADTYANLVTSRIQKFSDLPTVAPDGYVCRVLGDTASTSDDYFVQFVANRSRAFSHGVWTETASPDILTQIDADTMPWVLIHKGFGWVFEPFEWAERVVGEEETNPTPMFIDNEINNIFLYRNRLCILSSDVLCMSAAADHGRWWNETAFTFTDSDPIYISASTDEVTKLHDFGTMQESLILFGENGQFILQTPDTLSPKTAALLPLSSEPYSLHTGIINIGAGIYFGHKSRQSYNLKELGISSVTGQKETNSLTAHIPSYIPYGKIVQMKGSSSADTVVVRSTGRPDTLFVYKYYTQSSSRMQSAWSEFTIQNAEIKGMFFRESILWLYLWVNRQPFIATLDMEDTPITEDSEYTLDFPTTLVDADTITVWGLPAYLRDAEITALHNVEGVLTENPIMVQDSATIEVKYPTDSLIIGLKFKTTYEFSQQFITKGQEGNKTHITSGRWQLQQMLLQYGLSGPFEVLVQPTYDNSDDGYNYSSTGRTAGMQTAVLGGIPIAEGEFKVPLRGKNTDLRIIIQSDSWLPRSFVSASVQGNYITKVRTI